MPREIIRPSEPSDCGLHQAQSTMQVDSDWRRSVTRRHTKLTLQTVKTKNEKDSDS